MDFADWYRAVLILGSIVVTTCLTWQVFRARKILDTGQKLWATGAIFMLIYGSEAAYDAIQSDLGFRYRLIIWTLGLFAYFAYILEPRRSKYKRYGHPAMTKPPDHPAS